MATLNFRHDRRLTAAARGKLREFCSSLDEDLIELANSLGVKVYEEELWPYESGYLEYAPTCGSASNYRIVVNKRHPPERRRFSVAHELAHFLLHKDDRSVSIRSERFHRSDDHFEYLEKSDRLQEKEANAFAANLLMPTNLFKPAYQRLDGDVAKLAKLFFVSEIAAKNRCRDLGLRN